MPRHLVPKRSGVHRVACCALYRALLRRGHRLPLAEEQLNNLSKKFRNEFNSRINVQNPRAVRSAFLLGYKTLDTLSDAAHNLEALNQILGLIWSDSHPSSPSRYLNFNPSPPNPPPRPKFNAFPNALPVLSRPHPNISSKRHVPILVNASGVPFLRLGHAQPPNLSRLIRDKIKTRTRLIDRFHKFENEVEMAKEEDRWDGILERVCGLKEGEKRNSWESVVAEAALGVREKLDADQKKNMLVARRMFEIVGKERKLAGLEAVERRRAREKEANDRRRMRKLADDPLAARAASDAVATPTDSTLPGPRHAATELAGTVLARPMPAKSTQSSMAPT